MGFKFSYVCDLFSNLESNRTLKASSAARKRNPDVATVTGWFDRHGKAIHGGTTDRLALLSCLFPERRPERVFGRKEPSLVKIIGRCLFLGTSRRYELDLWKTSGGDDLGQCVENVMRQAENNCDGADEVTVEEIDAALNQVASNCRFSGPDVRKQRSAASVDEALGPIFRRLPSRDAKWFTRIILKDITPVELPASLILRSFHFLLPDLLLLQDSFPAAVGLLSREPIRQFPSRPQPEYAKLLSSLASSHMSLSIGVKVGRPDFYKARGIKHCCRMAGKRSMSVERKYDGEYCQIHIDLSKQHNSIQIFSKSGKDSTVDRRGVHSTLKECLGIGKPDCKFSQRCILEGELLVWSDVKSKILPFHKLRKHLPRSGTFIGTENDSPERRSLLCQIVHSIEGRAGIAEQEYISFSRPNSQQLLTDSFSTAISKRWEGLILKGSEEPYFSLGRQKEDHYFGHWIKLKKDYIAGLGDTADFAIIGARYDSQEASNGIFREIKCLKWTSFFVGCLEKSGKQCHQGRSVFRIVDVLNRHNINIQLMKALNELGQFRCCVVDDEDAPFATWNDQNQLPEVQDLFKTPFVVEMLGSGFEKPPGVNYYTLRFPRVLKIHADRDVEDAITLEELQQLAEEANSVPTDELSQEVTIWAEKLNPADRTAQYTVDASQSSSISGVSVGSPITTGLDSPPANAPMSANSRAEHGTSLQPPPEKFLPPQTSFPLRKRKQSTCPDPEPIPKRSAAIPRAGSPYITIHSDCSQSSTTTISDSQGTPHRHLTDLTNTSVLNNSQHTSNTVSSSDRNGAAGALTFDHNLGDETYALPSPEGNHSINQDFRPERDPASGNKPHSTANNLSSRSSIRVDNRSTYQISCLTTSSSFLESAPILLATQDPQELNGDIPYTSSRMYQLGAPSSIDQFLEKILNSRFASKHPSPPVTRPARSYKPLHHCGIVIVGSNPLHGKQTASTLSRIGNALVLKQRAGSLPQTGKIIFLTQEAFRPDIDENDPKSANIRDHWEKFGKRVFAGCLKWGYGVSSHRHPKSPKSGTLNSRARKRDQDDKTVAATTEIDVRLSWNWRELLSLP
ncbi:hypothetical protein FQN51_009014 [Onygenales sp. PD_10]|nr:hypothetical protein FQN51_009014 [Onygenales sp. PD_10]